jgi:N-acylneuraminate cytidylyltransferase
MQDAIAIITARGGSKRIPKKNIRPFMGKPMLNYAIEACLASELFSEVMVSTDSEEIANIAKSGGASVPFMRSSQTANDFATTFDVLEEVTSMYRALGRQFFYTACIYPCVPFLTGAILRDAFQAYTASKADALGPVCKYSVPVEWAMEIKDGILVPYNREAQSIRSQDLIPKYFDAGMFYFCKTEAMLRERTMQPACTLAYPLPESLVQDIDTEEDWKMAELKTKLQQEVSHG